MTSWMVDAGGVAAAAGREVAERRLRTASSPAYLRWRYLAIPSLRYAVLIDDPASSAWVLCRSRLRRGWLETSFSEIAVEDSPAARARWVERLGSLGAHLPGDYLIATAASNSAESRALAAAGFWRLPGAGPHLTVRRLDQHPLPVEPEEWANWRLSTGDLELF